MRNMRKMRDMRNMREKTDRLAGEKEQLDRKRDLEGQSSSVKEQVEGGKAGEESLKKERARAMENVKEG